MIDPDGVLYIHEEGNAIAGLLVEPAGPGDGLQDVAAHMPFNQQQHRIPRDL